MFKISLALVGLTLCLFANAAIVSLDSGFGAGTITRDTNTGLEWLDLTVTTDQSYNDVVARINGGDLQGWAYATGTQFDALIGSFGGQPMTCDSGLARGNDYCGWSSENNGVVAQVVSFVGDLYGRNESLGLLGDPYIYSEPDGIFWAYLSDYNRDLSPAYDRIETYYGFTSKDYSNPWTGSFLVRPSEVPLPAAAWLFGSAVLGLVVVKRKQA